MLFKESLAQWSPTRKRAHTTDTTMPQEFVERAVTLLVTSFMPLKPADLEGWMADPEEWVHAEEQEDAQWEFEIRPCAERVLLTFANQYSQYVSPLLAEAFNKINVLKRRVAWLIGKWVGDMCSNPNDTRIWQILLRLLSEKETGAEVVRLTAATAIRECVDSLDYNADFFVPFMGPIVKELLALIGDAESTESKRKVAHCLNTIIDRAEARIVPLIPMITEPLPELWASAGDEWLMKGTLLSTVSSVVAAAKDQSGPLAVIVVPLVRESLAPGASTHLDEDALGLWSAALRNTPVMARTDGASLIDLFPIAITLLSENLDLLGKVIGIIESYFLLDAVQVVQTYSHDLFPAFLRAMGQALSANVTDILIALELLFQLAPPSTYAEALHASGLFTSLMKTIGNDEADTIHLTHHIFILARIALADRNIFLQLMTVTATVHATPESQLWEGLLDQWWRRFDNMSEPRHRKLAAMGIASLLSTGRRKCSTELKEVMERQDDSLDNNTKLKAWWDRPSDAFFNETEGTLEYDRRKLTWDNDPVRTTALSSFIAVKLQEAEAACGGSQVMQTQYLSKADPTVLKQVMAEVARTHRSRKYYKGIDSVLLRYISLAATDPSSTSGTDTTHAAPELIKVIAPILLLAPFFTGPAFPGTALLIGSAQHSAREAHVAVRMDSSPADPADPAGSVKDVIVAACESALPGWARFRSRAASS
ncbi:hypothetical protein EWM64_g62 [Hericium alpestre]|uniref:Importin-7/11-like TPR repeats domain-containing protein n=1 Tax=Hericium alpestre TaxID=135208 RepID=A0A4Z0AA26_9AGAM|nr:hypothetical protein EWM64_g62 [Hericium alpestre]